MKAEVSCLNTRAIFDYLHRQSLDPRQFLRDLTPELNQLDEPFDYLNDRNNWVSSEVVVRLLARLKEDLKDEQLPFKIGYDTIVNRRFGYIQNIFLRLFLSPAHALRKAQEINDRFNRTKRVEVVHLESGKAVIRLHWFAGIKQSRDICLYNRGIYSAIFKTWGVKPASVTETKCAFGGSEVCEFRLRWQPVSRTLGFFKNYFISRSLFEDTVKELEEDKALLGEKYQEVQGLSLSLKKKIRELETIHESGKAIVSILDRKELLNVIMRLATSSLGYDRAMIMLLDDAKENLVTAASSGASREQMRKLDGYRIPLSRVSNVLVRTFNSGSPALVDEMSRGSLNQRNPILVTLDPKSFLVVPLISRGKVIGVMAADRSDSEVVITQEDMDYLAGFCNHVAVALENSDLYKDLEQAYLEAIQSLARAVDAKDNYTHGHSERVSSYAHRIAIAINLPERQKKNLQLACLIHDIGKIGVAEKILHKPGKLDRNEQTIIRQHPVIGESILRPMKGLEEVSRFIRHHHERYDGTGYPDRLKGDEIPLEARIMAIADCFDAMTTTRPYRSSRAREYVLKELRDCRGTQFDPFLVNDFLNLLASESFAWADTSDTWPQEI